MIERTVSMVPLELLQGGTRCSTGYTENTAVIQTERISSNKLLFVPSVALASTEPHRLSTLQLSCHISLALNV